MVQTKKITTEEKVKKTVKSAKSEKIVAEKKASKKSLVKKTLKQEAKKATVTAASGDVVESTVAVKAKKQTGQAVQLQVDVYDISGKVTGKVALPVALFGDKVNKTLLSQAVRVYLANRRQGTASTKTRGEVDGSTRKIYRQKGTGKARHGSIRAPIFVHGGIVHGPKPRDYSLDMPKKMKRKALFSALSAKLQDGEIKIISGLEAIDPKTKVFAASVNALGLGKTKNLLLVLPGESKNVERAAKNVSNVTMTPARQLNAYTVLQAKNLLMMESAIADLEKTFIKKV